MARGRGDRSHEEPFLTSSDAVLWLERVPPPYRLTCDLAVVPVVLPAAGARKLADAPVAAVAGQTIGALLLARYTAARFGPDATPYPVPPGDFYREAALALPVRGRPWPAFTFARMWVDTADDAPIALGHAYGFPKEPASITWERAGSRLHVRVATDGNDAVTLDLDAAVGPGLPGGWIAPLAGIWAVFPATGLRAAMRLEHTGAAALLRIRAFESSALASVGVRARPLPGLWLPGCVVALGAPQRTG